jgi:putative spermidine/putrescine transport system permease protein
MISGALLVFVMSFDKVAVVLFLANPEQRTLPNQMFSGIRQLISARNTAVATVLIVVSTAMQGAVQIVAAAAKG